MTSRAPATISFDAVVALGIGAIAAIYDRAVPWALGHAVGAALRLFGDR
ncbi:MAG TPA: hypothetical protein VKV32_13715 [Stellaceae bacterium]|nr:hypothetical protein [Stellaceae bacterium]